MKRVCGLGLLALLALVSCRRGDPAVCAELDKLRQETKAAQAQRVAGRTAYRQACSEQGAAKRSINRRSLDAMNLKLNVYVRTHGSVSLTREQVCELLPSPALEVYSGRNVIAPGPDKSGGWWWNHKRQRLEPNPLE